ncbi:MAG: exodeoxyribonuclease [Thermoleophilaceae bacterium]|jgi:exonuclease III|nr:exodeoxyribonuclease [Thermoleophilaceae bacterium]
MLGGAVVVLSWNVAGRVARATEQSELVADLGADVVCLQELTPTTVTAWTERLRSAGYHVEVAEMPAARESSRPLGVLIAARTELDAVPGPEVPWPERVLAARLADGLEVVNVHSPISPKPGLAKVLTHEAVFRHMLDGAGPRLVCGDLNTPRREHSDGSVWTFARTRNGSLRPERGERWDAAETSLIRGLEPSGFRDAFRERHGYAVKEVSWAWPRGGGYRLDHLIVSEEVRVDDCRYLHEWRTELKLSDHSPLIADLAVAR